MDSFFTMDVMEDTTTECPGGWQLPWNGWEEELFEDCPSLSLAEDAYQSLPVAATSLKEEGNSDGACIVGDDSNGAISTNDEFGDCFDIKTDIDFPGDLVAVCPLIDLFDIGDPLLDCGAEFLNLLENGADRTSVDESSVPHWIEVNSYFDSSTKPDDEVCIMTLKEDDEQCEMSNGSPLELDAVEELVVECSETLIDSEEQSSDQILSDSDYEIEASDDGDDDEDDDGDWEWTRRPRRSKRSRPCTRPVARSKKSVKTDPLLRKKEQNKNAATKYREKKKVEEMERMAVCEFLESRNRELRKEIEDKENEVKVLKELLVNVLRPSVRK